MHIDMSMVGFIEASTALIVASGFLPFGNPCTDDQDLGGKCAASVDLHETAWELAEVTPDGEDPVRKLPDFAIGVHVLALLPKAPVLLLNYRKPRETRVYFCVLRWCMLAAGTPWLVMTISENDDISPEKEMAQAA